MSEHDYTWEYPKNISPINFFHKSGVLRNIYTICLKASNDINIDKNLGFALIGDETSISFLQAVFLDDFVREVKLQKEPSIFQVGTIGRFTIYIDKTIVDNTIIIKKGDKSRSIKIKGLTTSVMTSLNKELVFRHNYINLPKDSDLLSDSFLFSNHIIAIKLTEAFHA